MSQPITIIGAGLGGLALACILHRAGMPVAVYDAEASPAVRPQGVLLDNHADGGQRALAAAGLLDAFAPLIRPGEDAKRIADRDGRVLFDRSSDLASARPEVDRGKLRDLLLRALPREAVRWGHKLVSVEPFGGGRHRLAFTGGGTVETALLVGADGAWLRVRPLLTAARPAYAGIAFVERHLAADNPAARAAATTIGTGTLMAVAPGRGILAHRNADGGIHVYLAGRLPEAETTARDRAPVDAGAWFVGWAPSLRALVPQTGSEVVRPIYALPVSLRWDRISGATLLGDAAHLMSPFAGEGANLAMRDGAELAAAILDHPDDAEAALAAYERAVSAQRRGRPAQRRQYGALLRGGRPDERRRAVRYLTLAHPQARSRPVQLPTKVRVDVAAGGGRDAARDMRSGKRRMKRSEIRND